MLNRRHIRLKAMQAFYAFTKNPGQELVVAQRHLDKSLNQCMQLFALQLDMLHRLQQIALKKIEDGKTKRLPSPEDLNPSMRFVEHPLLQALASEQGQDFLEDHRINDDGLGQIAKHIFKELSQTEAYEKYLFGPQPSAQDEKQFIHDVFVDFVAPNEKLQQLYEDHNMYWVDDYPLVNSAILQWMRKVKPNNLKIPKLFKDEDDAKFGGQLFQKAALHHTDLDDMIQQQTKNWELDRIATIDIVLIKMALIEMMHFNSIPVKVSINEYIELSKDFSTPKSKSFINGVLDKLAARLKEDGRIRKTGRGLIE